jgi:predicted transcriptional regulator
VTPDKNTQLTEVQLAVMRALWGVGRATTAAVHERMGKPRSLAYTTVATLLSRLEKRGLVISRKDGRERVFEPVVTERDVTRHMVSDLVAKLFRGDARALVSHLVSDSEFDETDLETVRRMLGQAAARDERAESATEHATEHATEETAENADGRRGKSKSAGGASAAAKLTRGKRNG